MIHNTYKIFNQLHRNFDLEKFSDYCNYFFYLYFTLLILSSLFFYKSSLIKKVTLFSLLIAGMVLYLSNIYPHATLDDKCFYFGRFFGFFDTIHPYVLLIFILLGTYSSKIIKAGLKDYILIEDNLYLMVIKYILSFFLGIFVYIPFTLYVNLISTPLTLVIGMLTTNYVLSFYLFEFMIWFPFGIYTGWTLDAFIKDYRPSTQNKIFIAFIISFWSVFFIITSGQFYLVNEGTK